MFNKRIAVIKNGDYISKEFDMQRGVRQGCPISPLLFIIAVEILALKIRQDDRTKGIELPKSTRKTKIKQYADDITLLLKDLLDFREVLVKIKKNRILLWITIERSKNVKHWDAYGIQFQGISIVQTVKILGIHFRSSTPAQFIETNWHTRIEQLKKVLAVWSKEISQL